MMSRQITSTLLMIRPVQFRFNEQTAANNYYQKVLEGLTPATVQEKALAEFDTFVGKLRAKGIEVVVINDTLDPDTPDSIFPNNWISFHADGRVGLYPMYAENRRLERRDDILQLLQKEHHFEIHESVSFTAHEQADRFLEGTGSMLLDRENKIVYAALSLRTEASVLDDFCDRFGYTAIKFTANQTVDGQRLAIYHTNVMMCLAEGFAVLCAESIDDAQERDEVISSLEKTGKEVILITEEQKHHFAGNMLQVMNTEGERFLVMSSAAYQSLTSIQIEAFHRHCPIVHSSLDTIEALGGGSARCMMAEVFLPRQKAS